jgi:hypothetical protein
MLAAAWVFATALLLTRVVFGLLIPGMAVAVVWMGIAMGGRRGRRFAGRQLIAALWPGVLAVGLLGAVNDVKFGSPWLTGYHQWRPEIHVPGLNPFGGMWTLDGPAGEHLFVFPAADFRDAGDAAFCARASGGRGDGVLDRGCFSGGAGGDPELARGVHVRAEVHAVCAADFVDADDLVDG